ncbi:Thioredoxin, putative [Perkinsus marinus ATCC 50983]|uniref:Thioredoxin, putative n=1 Tax=Perkinsus marinus (strain ATCC 50983 / TXsc) TaxID=423536 RepID=C5LL93_PERM5|nr:Thioredoxin, putative [Perkinsus marinus ATCC 50983]EER02510.1 Thioredoxin, putative [Perkinsus marinus ATCC 50983]|eukprot:XP_002769792.1 Thioredoxin, putative [Perkinsus marinus ATCC 50983]
MPVICLGPVCIPLWPLLALVLKPVWNLLPESVRDPIANAWYTMWEHCTFIPERFRPRRPVHRRGKAHCENGVCTWTRGDDNVKTEDDSTSTTKSTADIPQAKEDGEVIELQDPEEFDKLVVSKKLFIVDYSAEWCHPCQLIAPVFAELAQQYKDKATFVRVDVDALDDLALDNGVTSLPAFHIYQGNEKLETLVGANPEKLRATVAKRCGGN